MILRVDEAEEAAAGVRVLRLVDPEGGTLAPWEAGSHVELTIPLPAGSVARAYSLTGDPDDRSAYRLAVRREDPGRGGSAWLHDQLAVGDPLEVSPPIHNLRGVACQQPASNLPATR